jgi:hypothetical protein
MGIAHRSLKRQAPILEKEDATVTEPKPVVVRNAITLVIEEQQES